MVSNPTNQSEREEKVFPEAMPGLSCPPSMFPRRTCFLAGPVVLNALCGEDTEPHPVHTCSCPPPQAGCWLVSSHGYLALGSCVTDLSVKDSQPGRSKLSRTQLLQRTAFSRVFFLLPRMCLAPWSVMNRGTGLLTGHAVGRLPQDPLSPASTDCTPSGAILSALASEPPGTLRTVRQLSPPPGLGAHE